MNKTKPRVLLGLSGGVDSFASALMLKEQGFEVVCATFITWDKNTKGISVPLSKTIPEETALKTAQVCSQLAFEHHILSLCQEFEETVIEHFVSAYLSGKTPNICTFCNKTFKFTQLQKAAFELNCNYIATGHYADIRHENGRFIISRATDDWKDQSFMLWQLPQSILKMCIFPLANNLKSDVKTYVADLGFREQAQQNESFNICFIPDDDYKGFLCRRIDGLKEKLANGTLLNTAGEKIGTHEGFPFYTIGQSKGFQTSIHEKKYVKEIIAAENQIILSSKQETFTDTVNVNQLNFIKYESLKGEFVFWVRIRGKDPGAEAKVFFNDWGEAHIQFNTPVFAPAIGQSVVFYEGKDVVGGGIIF